MGWTFANHIRELFPDLQITLMTGGDPTGELATAEFPRLNKPMQFAELERYLKVE